jgi:hypothetical protein
MAGFSLIEHPKGRALFDTGLHPNFPDYRLSAGRISIRFSWRICSIWLT